MPQAPLDAWLGRQETLRDTIAPTLVERMAATLDDTLPVTGDALPLLWHWMLFQPAVAPAGLGADGHPARGGFLPPAQGRIRMWAGGRLDFIAPLTVGAAVRRESTITAIDEKAGRTGSLLFVTVRHEVYEGERLSLREEQDIVYREPTPPRLASGQACPAADWVATVHPTPTLLFRYSAVTFNGHRIHYDHPYATETEGYPGLVVHGPLIATLTLQAFGQAHPQARVRRFTYRGLRPLIAPQPFTVGGRIDGPGHADTWAGNADGLAQTSTVEFES